MDKPKLDFWIQSFRCDETTKDGIKKIANRKGRNIQEITRAACKFLIKEYEKGLVLDDEYFN